MKKLSLIILFLLAGFTFSSSQDLGENQGEEPFKTSPEKREKMFREVQEFKMKYLAQEMELSEVQKVKFYELYEEEQASKKECYQEAVVMDRRLKKEKDPSEENYQQVRSAFNMANMKWAEIEKQYDEKYSEFLSQKQIYKMKEAENSFRAKFEEMKHNRKREHHKKDKDKK